MRVLPVVYAVTVVSLLSAFVYFGAPSGARLPLKPPTIADTDIDFTSASSSVSALETQPSSRQPSPDLDHSIGNRHRQDVYDQYILMLYKLYMEDHLHMPYNFYGENVTQEVRTHPIGGFRGYFGPVYNKAVLGVRSYAPSLLEWVLRETLVRHADVKAMKIPAATRQCFLDVMAAPDRLDLAARPKSRHDTRSYFELVGAGVDANTTAIIPADRILKLTVRVRRDADNKPLWYKCGDLFNARVLTKQRVGVDVFNTLPVVSVPAMVMDNFDYSYTVVFAMPRDYPAGQEWGVEVLHEKHRFNHLRPFAGEKAAKEENWNEFLNDYIDGSPFPFRFREEDSLPSPPPLPLYAGGFLPGSYVNDAYVPDDTRLITATPELFNRCFAEHNYCFVLWGCSVTSNMWVKLRDFLPPSRSRYERLGGMAWRGVREGKAEKLEVVENIRLAMDLGLVYHDAEDTWLNCTADPTAQVVHVVNSGVHEVAWGEVYPFTVLGTEWFIRQLRELYPKSIVIWNRSAAIHLKRFALPYTDRENEAQMDYRNCFSNTRLELFDLLARRTMRFNNLTFMDIYGPTIAAPEYTTGGDMRHYYSPSLRFLPDLIYTRLCTGAPPPRIGDVMLPLMPDVKTDTVLLLERLAAEAKKP